MNSSLHIFVMSKCSSIDKEIFNIIQGNGVNKRIIYHRHPSNFKILKKIWVTFCHTFLKISNAIVNARRLLMILAFE